MIFSDAQKFKKKFDEAKIIMKDKLPKKEKQKTEDVLVEL